MRRSIRKPCEGQWILTEGELPQFVVSMCASALLSQCKSSTREDLVEELCRPETRDAARAIFMMATQADELPLDNNAHEEGMVIFTKMRKVLQMHSEKAL